MSLKTAINNVFKGGRGGRWQGGCYLQGGGRKGVMRVGIGARVRVGRGGSRYRGVKSEVVGMGGCRER